VGRQALVSFGRLSLAAVAESYLRFLLSWRYPVGAVLGGVRLSVGVRAVASVVAAARVALARAYRCVPPFPAVAAPWRPVGQWAATRLTRLMALSTFGWRA